MILQEILPLITGFKRVHLLPQITSQDNYCFH